MPDTLKIRRFCLGDWATNCYVVSTLSSDTAGDPQGGACWIVDAGFDPGYMLRYIAENGFQLEKVVLTHAHVDHIGGLAEILAEHPGTPVVIHHDELAFPADPMLNLSAALDDRVVAPEPTGTMTHGDTLTLGGNDFEVRHTPGHSPGGVCLYQRENNVAIVGDTLFAGSIGRHDFPTSDGPTLMRSIHEQLLTLPDTTRVLPGHGPETSIANERATNPFLQD